jgi:hypothetical protein
VFVWRDGFQKKLVTEHSQFPKSPFELGRFMHTITWRKKTTLLDWLEPGVDDWGHLTRCSVWDNLIGKTKINMFIFTNLLIHVKLVSSGFGSILITLHQFH